MIEYGINKTGTGLQVFEPVTLGFPSREYIGKTGFSGTTIGNDAVIRSGTIIYCDVTIGNRFQAGHNVLIREKTRIGDHVSVGTGVIIEGNTILGNNVNLQSMVYIPTNSTIKDHVFIGPNAILTNDRYPPSGIGGLVRSGDRKPCSHRSKFDHSSRHSYRGRVTCCSRCHCDPGCTGTQTCCWFSGRDSGYAVSSSEKMF